jgi:meso-butanediol dehydrogenase/(S,S)-butanediol dehydrogenase/diacetyl reductase
LRFAGKVAIVTGGSSGIGAAIARGICREGGSVMIADLNGAGAAQVAAELGDQAAFRVVDVSDAQALSDLVAATAERFGGIDILFNNAGIGCFGETPDLALEQWHKVIAVNLDAVFFGCRAVIPYLRARGAGAIVNTASASGMSADYGFTAYNAAKAGVINYTRSLAIDHAQEGIRANAIAPGPVDTAIMAGIGAMPGLRTAWEERVPAGRFARPDEVAAVALFLASDEASGVTGVTIPVDGGLTAHTGQPDIRKLMAEMAQ